MVDSAQSFEPGKLFVGGIHLSTDKKSLQAYFEQFGEVSDCVVMRDELTKKSRGFGFVTFTQPETVSCDEITKRTHILDGKTIDPKPATTKEKDGENKKYTCKLFLGGLDMNTTDEDVLKYFNNHDLLPNVTATRAEIKRDTDHVSKRFGFMTVDSESSLDLILKNGPKYEINGKMVEVKKANPQNKPQQRGQFYDQNDAQMMYVHQQAYQRYLDHGSHMNNSNGSYLQYGGGNIPQNYSNFSQPPTHSTYSYDYDQYARGGYNGGQQQMSGSYHHGGHDGLYNQSSSSFSGNNPPSYTSSGYYNQHAGYSYPNEQTGGSGGSPSYTRPAPQSRGTGGHQYPYGNR